MKTETKPFMFLKKTRRAWAKLFFGLFFSCIPALKFHTKHYTAIALNAMLCEVLLPIIKIQKIKSISHNVWVLAKLPNRKAKLKNKS